MKVDGHKHSLATKHATPHDSANITFNEFSKTACHVKFNKD